MFELGPNGAHSMKDLALQRFSSWGTSDCWAPDSGAGLVPIYAAYARALPARRWPWNVP